MWLGGCTQASECAAAEANDAACCKPCWVLLWRCDGHTVLACSQGAFGEAGEVHACKGLVWHVPQALWETVAWMRACSESVWSLQKNNRAVRLEWVMLCVVLRLLIRLHILVLGCGVWATHLRRYVGDTAAAG